MFWKKIQLVTHDGKFHADDIFACATLQLWLGKQGKSSKVTRTRDSQIIDGADYVFDVGAMYDPEKNRFDHHQKGGAGKRENGVPYASIGLVWKHFGEKLCGSKEVADIIDEKLVQSLDADDNGMSLVEIIGEVVPYSFHQSLYAFRPTWKEEQDFDDAFFKLVKKAQELIAREIKVIADNLSAKDLVKRDYKEAKDKRLVITEGAYPWESFLTEYAEPLFVVYPRGNMWRVGTVPTKSYSFERRKDLPESWAGLRDEELVEITEVKDAVFCHNGRFMAVAKSKEGALQLAKLALES